MDKTGYSRESERENIVASKLYLKKIEISDAISIVVPTVGQIIDNEDDYYQIACMIVATPYDMMVQLDDAHIDFTKIDDFELFVLLFENLKGLDTSLMFGDLELSGLKAAKFEGTGELVLRDQEKGITIDRVVHAKLCDSIRKMLHMEKNSKKPGNEETRKYLIDRERKRQKRAKKGRKDSQLENYIVALVNTEQFPYNYETVRNISIYQFYASLNQIAHRIKYDNTMIGYYAGTIKFEDLAPADRTWIKDTQ